MTTDRARPYRLEFPDSPERARSSRTLEDALSEARWILYTVWRETTEHGEDGAHIHDADRAVITNRDTGYRWILRRGDTRVEFQTPEMFGRAVGREHIYLAWTIEEAEAVATAASSAQIKDRNANALVNQALDQLAMLCAEIRERVRGADLYFEWRRGIYRRPPDEPAEEPEAAVEGGVEEEAPKPPPEFVSLKGAARILGKAHSTIYKWYREGKFPPAVDLTKYSKTAWPNYVIVPLDRLEAWRNGERMRPVLQEVFEFHGLHEQSNTEIDGCDDPPPEWKIRTMAR